MKNVVKAVPIAAVVLAAACGEAPTDVRTAEESAGQTFVLTQGSPAPVRSGPGQRPLSDLAAFPNLGGSVFSPMLLAGKGCDRSVRSITVRYTITGQQDDAASFQVSSVWTYNGSGWVGSWPVRVDVPARTALDAPMVRSVFATVINGTASASGEGSFTIVPFDVVTSGAAPLDVSVGDVTVHVEFEPCDVATSNSRPTLGLPAVPLSIEATSSAGASVDPLAYVTASDFEDGDLTAAVVCLPTAGAYALGDTQVDCSVQDSGGEQAQGGFTVRVVDTTPPEFANVPTGVVGRIAENAGGWAFDLSSFGITASDVPLATPVSDLAGIRCTTVDGTVLAVGSSTDVNCTASDQAGNEGAATFTVLVTLDMAVPGFLPPLRNESPYSAHKKGSTIPHKLRAPLFGDGTQATDLAACLKLVVINKGGGSSESFASQPDDFSTGSSVWRWDPDARQYLFNAKTAAWNPGIWETTVSCGGIVLARTIFELRK